MKKSKPKLKAKPKGKQKTIKDFERK